MSRPLDRDEVAQRLHEATLRCAARSSTRFSLEDVAREAGVSRSTVYRCVPGGREQLIHDAVEAEVASFFTRLTDLVADCDGLADKIDRALEEGRHLLDEHEVLQLLLREDPTEILSELDQVMDQVRVVLIAYVDEQLAAETILDPPERALRADTIARLFLSHLATSGVWDLDDPASRRRLVETQYLPGRSPSPRA